MSSKPATDGPANTVTIGIADLADVKSRARAAFRGRKQGAHITFASHDLLMKTLTPKRWDLLRAMTGLGPTGIRPLARRVERDVKSVHRDVQAMLKAGLLQATDDGKVEFPWDAIHVDFMLKAA
ncbi:HVO_A0114 family putative DNA-binding protein [Ferrovibrio xuzhouensis]|uniref:Transcriptional regulator n=1 Tax=Ferrovibrio xuzhouensis TaxID=1576914 RepID=A0ABV7VJU7_9PROT